MAQLMKSTLNQYMNDCIPLLQLPLTFRNAISVTKRLGIRYLWIDSMCIIQDSDDDWLEQSACMWAIYMNSYCTLAATASTNGNRGLFRDREPYATTPQRINATWDGLEKGFYNCTLESEWTTEVIQAPLNRRGWVLQERLLSSRVLHFAESQVYWNCEDLLASEALPHGLPKKLGTESFTRDWHWIKPKPLNVDFFKRLIIWHNWVAYYSKCALTRDSDKLVAVSGMARLVHQRYYINYTYLAGLWSRDLARQLLWETGYPNEVHSRPNVYRAPSWSWASIDGPIRSGDPQSWTGVPGGYGLLVEILHAHTKAVRDSFGQVTDGIVRLRARIFQITLESSDFQDSYGRQQCSIFFKGYRDDAFEVHVNADEGLRAGTKLDEGLYCVPFESFKKDSKCHITGLLLQLTGRAEGEFRRYGYFRSPLDNWEFYNLMTGNRVDGVAAEELVEGNGNGLSTIVIV